MAGLHKHSPTLLELDLSHPLIEHEPDDPIAKLRSRGKPRLRPVLRALHEAGDDPQVVGLVAKIGDTSMTLARAQELRDAVAAFAASGKPTVAWADTFGESGPATVPYLLATGFGEIWLQPTGELNLNGVAAEVMFLRGAFDKLGVEPQLGQRYEYKNAADRIAQQIGQKKAPGVAVVDGFGGIVTGRSRRTPLQGPVMGSDTVTAAFRAAVRDERVRAIVFRVDSPGGSAVASDSILREVECARAAGKPVVVSMGSVAGSGGYYVACKADAILAEPGTLTGSIGVLGGKPVLTELTDRLGLNVGAVQRGAHARMHSTHVGYDEAQLARLEAMLDRVYDDFTSKVSEGRGMSREAVHEVARGRVWTGADAARHGLVDSLGGLRDAVSSARSRAGLPADAPARPAVSVPPLARLRPARSTEDPRAAASVSMVASVWTDGWGGLADVAAWLGLPVLGPLTMPGVRLR